MNLPPLSWIFGPPGPGTGLAVGTGGSTVATALGVTQGGAQAVYLVWEPTTAADNSKCHVRFGGSGVGAATTDDTPLSETKVLRVVPEPGVTHLRAIASVGAGTLHIAAAVLS